MSHDPIALHIELGPMTPGGRAVRTLNRRPLHMVRLLEGRSAEQALRMLPRLFGVCSHSHQAAGADALRAALPGAPGERAARHRLAGIESLREQLLQILCEWPPALAFEARRDAAVDMLRLALAAQDEAPALRELATWAGREVFHMPAADWLALRGVGELQAWARHGTGAAAEFVHRLFDEPAGSPVEPLPALEPLDLRPIHARMAADDTLGFAREPQLDGQCLESGPTARQREHPLARACAGHGLLARFVARLIDVAVTLEELARGTSPRPEPGDAGLGWADCARGRLLHHAELDPNGRIRRYRIVAPTEWNTHPRGLCARLLGAIGPGAWPTLRRQARLVMLAVDPCVPARVLLPPTELPPGSPRTEAVRAVEVHHA